MTRVTSFCRRRKNGIRPWSPGRAARGTCSGSERRYTRNEHTLRIFSGRLHSVSFRANGYKGQRLSTSPSVADGHARDKRARMLRDRESKKYSSEGYVSIGLSDVKKFGNFFRPQIVACLSSVCHACERDMTVFFYREILFPLQSEIPETNGGREAILITARPERISNFNFFFFVFRGSRSILSLSRSNRGRAPRTGARASGNS